MTDSGLTLGSWPGTNPDHNRFLQVLLGAIEAEGVRVVSFPESRSIRLDGLDVLLVHWPDKVFWEASSSREAAGLMTRLLARLEARPRRMKRSGWSTTSRLPRGKWFMPWYDRPMPPSSPAWPTGRSPCRKGPRAAVLAAYPALAGKPLEHVWHPAYPGEALAPEARAAARAGLGWADAGRVYGYCGQLRLYKGVEDLLRAFAGLPDAGARLLVAGRPRDAGFAAALGELAGEDPPDPPGAGGPVAGAVPRLPRGLRHRGGAVPALPALGLDRACPERRAAGADAGDTLRRGAAAALGGPGLGADLPGPADPGHPRRQHGCRRRPSTSPPSPRRPRPPAAARSCEALAAGRPRRHGHRGLKARPPRLGRQGAGSQRRPPRESGGSRGDLIARVVPGLPAVAAGPIFG